MPRVLRFPRCGAVLGLLALCATLVALGGEGAFAQNELAFGANGEVVVTTDYRWPEEVIKGFVPVTVRIHNGRAEDCDVGLALVSQAYDATRETVSRTVNAPAGEVLYVEMLARVAAGTGYWTNYWLEVEVGRETHRQYGVPALTDPGRLTRAAVVLAARGPTEQEVLDWTSAIGGAAPEVSLTGVAFADAPRRFEAYTSLDLVVVDSREPVPAAVLEPVLSWVRTGGAVAFAGRDALRRAREHPEIARWLEDRFVMQEEGQARTWRMGHGRLLVLPSAALFEAAAEVDMVRGLFDEHESGVPSPFAMLRPWVWPAIPGLEELPYRVLILLLILFAVVIGPVNFSLVKASGRPSLLLVTIPLLALFAAGAILAYGILYQGIDVKSASHTHTILDQRGHRAATVESRSLFAGLSPGTGLTPAPGTACFPRQMQLDGLETNYRLDLDRDVLGSDYVPVRRLGRQTLFSDRAARARLEVRRAGGDVTVTNALGAPVEYLFVRDPDGGTHVLEGTLPEGATAVLRAVDEQELVPYLLAITHHAVADPPDELDPLQPLPVSGAPFLFPASLWRAGYVAVLAANPFADDCGLASNELAGAHFVYGVLEADGEEWR